MFRDSTWSTENVTQGGILVALADAPGENVGSLIFWESRKVTNLVVP